LWYISSHISSFRSSGGRRHTKFWQQGQAEGRKYLKDSVALKFAKDAFVQGFRYGQTEVLKQSQIATKVRDLLRCESPLILLVHDEGVVRALLGDLGIKVSGLCSGLKSLLQ
jgi:hypothetical protein